MEMWEFLQQQNSLHMMLKNFERTLPKEFEKTTIRQCGHCSGTGLKDCNVQLACPDCFGVGYTGFKSIGDKTICPYCNSTGGEVSDIWVNNCKTCKGSGFLDWIDAIKAGVSVEGLL